jgi:hypothetical protein
MRPHRNLARASFDELAREAVRRGYRLVPVAATLDKLVPIDPGLFEEIRDCVRAVPALCREVAAQNREIYELRDRLTVADGAVSVLVANGWDEGLAELMGESHG